VELDPSAAYVREPREQGPAGPESFLRPRTAYVRGELSSLDVTQGIRKDELLRLLLAGFSIRDSAQKLHVHKDTLRKYIKEVTFQEELKRANSEIWHAIDEELRFSKLSTLQKLEEMSELALERIKELISSDDESIALRASSDTLDRNAQTSKKSLGLQAEFKIQLSPEQLVLAAQAAVELDQRKERNVTESVSTAPET